MVSGIIVAAGKGSRMGPNVDKLFLEVNGCPVVGHTWRLFDRLPAIDELVIVLREGSQSSFEELGKKCKFSKPFRLIAGGAERQDSVWQGLAALSPTAEIVAIQDAARPCTSEPLIASTIAAARDTGAAVAAQPVTDTIKESSDGRLIERTLDRSRLWAIQTPQAFRREALERALSQPDDVVAAATDDAGLVEALGGRVGIVEAPRENLKVTTALDLALAERLLAAR